MADNTARVSSDLQLLHFSYRDNFNQGSVTLSNGSTLNRIQSFSERGPGVPGKINIDLLQGRTGASTVAVS